MHNGQGDAHQPTRGSTSTGVYALVVVNFFIVCGRQYVQGPVHHLETSTSTWMNMNARRPFNVNARSPVSSATCTQGSRSTVHCGGGWCARCAPPTLEHDNMVVYVWMFFMFTKQLSNLQALLNSSIQCTTWMNGMDVVTS
ncbi:hypothetical protein Mgra_00005658 [Meloidogyne graminicola]|uniref:Uncharacterized protein n=1 Tax=Meloidogyne graminicola TaxID=189291 RepID=A0A8S9ZPA8_9BILA|nr:hypothetical protein Mgra_00005658 [Meloidogyne graminicola]